MGFLSDLFGSSKKVKISKGMTKDGGWRYGITAIKGGKKGKHETAWTGLNGKSGRYEQGWHGEKKNKK